MGDHALRTHIISRPTEDHDMRRHLSHGLIVATLLVVTACGGDDDSPSGSSTDVSTDSTDSTTVGTGVDGSGVTVPDSGDAGGSTSTSVKGSTGTTVAGSGGSTGTTVAGSGGSTDTTVAGSTGTTVAGPVATVVSPPTTDALPQSVADLMLRSDGVGPLRFGADVDAVVAAINPILGAPSSDAPAAYPVPAGDGTFKSQDDNGDDELGFVQPFGRTVCWTNGLCLESGGATAGPYAFVGWYYAATDTNELATSTGLKVGSKWADFTSVMTAEPGGCYTVGYGSSEGISLTLQSDGAPFSSFDEAGNETTALPDPADVTVVQMQAGSQVAFLIGDC